MGIVSTLPQSRALTRDDLDAMPDDGHRYELVDGALIVTPAPSFRHQRAVLRLAVLLDQVCPADLVVMVAPFDVALTRETVLQPDVLVARRVDVTERDLPAAPLLAAEVLSPSTRLIDLELKRSRYEEAGAPSYWVVDPDVPTVIIWELEAGRYVEVAHVGVGESVDVSSPFPMTFTPAQLVT